MKALVGAFNQEKARVGAFSVIVQPVVEPMEHYTALIKECHEGSREPPPPEVADSETEYYETSVARVSGSQALQLLHHYLQKITVDRFTRLTIAWTVKVCLSCREKNMQIFSFFSGCCRIKPRHVMARPRLPCLLLPGRSRGHNPASSQDSPPPPDPGQGNGGE